MASQGEVQHHMLGKERLSPVPGRVAEVENKEKEKKKEKIHRAKLPGTIKLLYSDPKGKPCM